MTTSTLDMIARLFARTRHQKPASRKTSRRSSDALRSMETLESRAMLSATVDDNGLLTIVGTQRRDVIEVRPGTTLGSVLLRGVAGVARDAEFTNVTRVSISSLGGNDKISIAAGILDGSGNAIPFTVDAGAGDDGVDGGDGDDAILGGTGNDTVRGNGGNDDIDLGAGNDFGFGGAGDDRIVGGRGVDREFGGVGDDTLDGGGENDVLRGEDGDDTLTGGVGNDSLLGGTGNDNASGDAGNDSILGEAGDDRLAGGSGRDTIRGGVGDDSLDGGDDNDDLFGDDGNDSINGGRGRDRIRGGAGTNSSLDDSGDEDLDRAGRATVLQFAGNTLTVTGSSASKDDKKFFTFRVPEGVSKLSVVLDKGQTGDYADLEIESLVGEVKVVSLEPSENSVTSASDLAVLPGQAYKLRLRAPDRSPVEFTATLTVA